MVDRSERALERYSAYLRTPVTLLLSERATRDPVAPLLALFRRTVEEVPAYGAFLREHAVDPSAIDSLAAFRTLPFTTKENYVQRHPLASRCRGGELAHCDMLAVSSGSTGEPTVWPRCFEDELAIAYRFEQVFHDSFEADRRRTLAVVCFPLGTWVGGMFTAACCQRLGSKGYLVTVATPGNHKLEILRVLRALSPQFEQTVLLGYPPFLKEVVDLARNEGLPLHSYALKLVLAGEVISEEYRDLMAERAGCTRLLHDSASLYGTADAGVLGNETPLSIAIRRFLRSRPDAARALFGEARLPTLVQYDPHERFFEQHEGTLLFSGDNGVPLLRYHISDEGGVVPYATMLERLRELGFDGEAEVRRESARGLHALPFVYVFGRSHFALSYFGANVFPDTVAIALEQPSTRDSVSGKFVLELVQHDGNAQLSVAVELSARGMAERSSPMGETLESRVADAVLGVLLKLNSEYANYVPPERQRPLIKLLPSGDPEYFPLGVKHRYARK